jgi:hypothetical protein
MKVPKWDGLDVPARYSYFLILSRFGGVLIYLVFSILFGVSSLNAEVCGPRPPATENQKKICAWIMASPELSVICDEIKDRTKVLPCIGGEAAFIDGIGYRGITTGVAKGATAAIKDAGQMIASGTSYAWRYLSDTASE